MSIIKVKDLKVQTILGIHPWEQEPREVIINLTLDYNTSKAELSDNIKDTLDYDTLATDITDYCKTAKTNLIEHLAHNIIEIIQKKYITNHIEVEIDKPGAIKNARSVSIAIVSNS